MDRRTKTRVAVALVAAAAVSAAPAHAQRAPDAAAKAVASSSASPPPLRGASVEGQDRATIGPATFKSVLAPGLGVKEVKLGRYRLDREPVTNAQFLAFVTRHPEWRRGRIPAIYADASYLANWQGPMQPGAKATPAQPVVQVSWYAARAYCEAQGARLPTWYEWEYAAAADETRIDARDDPAWKERILAWYGRSSAAALPSIGRTPANVYGVRDLHGLVWEWVEDYAGLMVSGDSRDQGDPDKLKFCGAGALSAENRDEYAVLMRMAMLSSLEAHYTTGNLGFRCASNP
jgi:formylglycine-generating enzyme required for sulfatase activity